MLELNKIYNQDCMEGLKNIDDCSIDCIVTDPPYRITSRGNCGTAGGMFKTKLGQNGKLFEHNDIDIYI